MHIIIRIKSFLLSLNDILAQIRKFAICVKNYTKENYYNNKKVIQEFEEDFKFWLVSRYTTKLIILVLFRAAL